MNKLTEHLVFDHDHDPLIHEADADGAVEAHTEAHDEDGDREHAEVDGRILHVPRTCRYCRLAVRPALAPHADHWVHQDTDSRECDLPPRTATPW